MRLKDKAALVTGASRGIGRAIALALAAEGADVALNYSKSVAEADKVAQEIKSLGRRTTIVQADVADKAAVNEIVKKVVDELGRIDILVNNAGILIPRLLVDPAGKEELTEQIWDKMVSINQKGYYLCAQATTRVMIKSGRGGVIINMTSESGLEGSEGQSVYAATKAAIYSLTRSWAKELGKHNIRVVGIAPGIVEATDLRSDEYERAVAYTRGVTVEQFRDKYEQVSIPLGRSGKLSEVANTVCFLASDRAGYIHGTVINVSGGKSRA